MLFQYNLFIHLIQLVMKLFIKILRIIEIALPFIKTIVDNLSKDKEKKEDQRKKDDNDPTAYV